MSGNAVPILQPGAPGEATRELDAETAVNIPANSSYTVALTMTLPLLFILHE